MTTHTATTSTERTQRGSSTRIFIKLLTRTGTAGPLLVAEIRNATVELWLDAWNIAIIHRDHLRTWLLTTPKLDEPMPLDLDLQHAVMTYAERCTFLTISDGGCYLFDQDSLNQLTAAL